MTTVEVVATTVGVEVLGETSVDVQVTPGIIDLQVTSGPVDIEVSGNLIDVAVTPPPTIDIEVTPSMVEIDVAPMGVPGGPGPAGPGGGQELFDSATPPLNPPGTYLRFERDVDGDVQAIYLGTVD